MSPRSTTPFARRLAGAGLLAAAVIAGATAANEDANRGLVDDPTVSDALEADVRTYDLHVMTLANPFMEGRVPGSEGMERAKDYVEYHFVQYGLDAPWTDADGAPSYRQPFDLGGTMEVTRNELAGLAGGRAFPFTPDVDFNVLGLGGSGDVTAPVTFVGYSVDSGPDGYSSYGEDADLSGEIALMLRFEPMDAEGNSRWSERGWSQQASFGPKVRAAIERGAAGIVIVNTPGASDSRVEQLMAAGAGGRGNGDVPVVMMTSEAADAFLQRADPMGRSLMEMRELADETGGTVDLDGVLSIGARLERTPLRAENVGGLLPGRGDLADEYIVVGGHLDHLGMGYFGSRSGPGELHPGADDNASGSAGVLLFAEMLAETYANLPEDADLRSVLFVAFDGEESGLNGSRHYVQDPLGAIEDHVLMINFDMIGRILEGRLSLSGANTGTGLAEFIQPHVDNSALTVIQPERMNGASDHTSFYRAGVPVLFGIIHDFHGDYHTPNDVVWKINRLDATRTIHLFHAIVADAAQRAERFEFAQQSRRARRGGGGGGDAAAEGGGGGGPAAGGPQLSDITVRFGITPGSYDESSPGIPIAAVSEGGSAEAAGVRAGDTLVRWDGQKIQTITDWMTLLAKHKPGDTVKIGVKREGEEITLEATLQARENPGG